LERTNPSLLHSVGIVRVDWWFRFYRGVWRLAFSSSAHALAKRDRVLMRSFWIFYILLPVALGALKLSGR